MVPDYRIARWTEWNDICYTLCLQLSGENVSHYCFMIAFCDACKMSLWIYYFSQSFIFFFSTSNKTTVLLRKLFGYLGISLFFAPGFWLLPYFAVFHCFLPKAFHLCFYGKPEPSSFCFVIIWASSLCSSGQMFLAWICSFFLSWLCSWADRVPFALVQGFGAIFIDLPPFSMKLQPKSIFIESTEATARFLLLHFHTLFCLLFPASLEIICPLALSPLLLSLIISLFPLSLFLGSEASYMPIPLEFSSPFPWSTFNNLLYLNLDVRKLAVISQFLTLCIQCILCFLEMHLFKLNYYVLNCHVAFS